jgi:hypothetical protein
MMDYGLILPLLHHRIHSANWIALLVLTSYNLALATIS